MNLVKAQLISPKGEAPPIQFMFNPTQLAFQQSAKYNEEGGARTEKGLPKLSFAHPTPRTLTISNIIFDTYESGSSVMGYISLLEKAINFAESGEGAKKRPPLYVFTWGSQKYLRCFVKTLSWTLTMFDSKGVPVRAKVDITLEEADESQMQPAMTTPNGDRQGDSRDSRS